MLTLDDYEDLVRRIAPEVIHLVKEESADYETQWKNLGFFNENYDIHFIHVDDKQNRDKQVSQLGEMIGMELSCDWQISKESNAIHGTHNLELTDEIVSQVPDWIMDVYHGTR